MLWSAYAAQHLLLPGIRGKSSTPGIEPTCIFRTFRRVRDPDTAIRMCKLTSTSWFNSKPHSAFLSSGLQGVPDVP